MSYQNDMHNQVICNKILHLKNKRGYGTYSGASKWSQFLKAEIFYFNYITW